MNDLRGIDLPPCDGLEAIRSTSLLGALPTDGLKGSRFDLWIDDLQDINTTTTMDVLQGMQWFSPRPPATNCAVLLDATRSKMGIPDATLNYD